MFLFEVFLAVANKLEYDVTTTASLDLQMNRRTVSQLKYDCDSWFQMTEVRIIQPVDGRL